MSVRPTLVAAVAASEPKEEHQDAGRDRQSACNQEAGDDDVRALSEQPSHSGDDNDLRQKQSPRNVLVALPESGIAGSATGGLRGEIEPVGGSRPEPGNHRA